MKLNKRAVALLISLTILVTVVVGTTVAFLYTESNAVNNTFVPSKVTCEVVDKTNHVYSVKNTGDTAAYIRVAILVNWKNDDGQLYAQAPVFSVTPGESWILGVDGYYYFTHPVAVGAEISEVLGIGIIDSEVPTGYEISIEIVVSAIQATSVAVQDWSNGVAEAPIDGAKLIVKTQ